MFAEAKFVGATTGASAYLPTLAPRALISDTKPASAAAFEMALAADAGPLQERESARSRGLLRQLELAKMCYLNENRGVSDITKAKAAMENAYHVNVHDMIRGWVVRADPAGDNADHRDEDLVHCVVVGFATGAEDGQQQQSGKGEPRGLDVRDQRRCAAAVHISSLQQTRPQVQFQ